MSFFTKTRADVLERVFWTAIQAGLGVITVDALNLPKVWIPIVAFAIAAIKSAIATQVGTKGSAALLPSNLDASVLDSAVESVVDVSAESV